MAELIEYNMPKVDPRAELFEKLRLAPIGHAQAILDAYEVLQLMREKGLLELAKTSLSSGENLVELASEIVERKEFVALSRNATILIKLVGGINPAVLGALQKALSGEAKAARRNKSPGFFSFLGALFSADGRRALGAMGVALKTLGKGLPDASLEGAKELNKKVYRHEVHE